ncbi:MAG: hypothetical protein UHK60_02715 [Acutalibacteraceae bacterium]|nr:hypothetical protein [Acutalibacteraceae bacterium]
MTSTISLNKSKKPLLSMTMWGVKKALPIIIIYSFLLCMCFPMYIILSKKQTGVERFSYVQCQQMLIEVVPLLICVATIITACLMFNIYHKKRSVDLYASLPVKKHTLFLSRYFAGLLVVIVPLVVFMSLGLFASCEINSLNALVTYNRMLAYIVSIINMYSMLAFFSMICGGTVDTLVSFGVVNIGVASCLSLGTSLITNIVPGCFNLDVSMMDRFSYMLVYALCPVMMPFISGTFADIYCDSNYNLVYSLGADSLEVEVKTLVLWFVLALVYLAAAIVIAKKRRNENVQNGFIFSFPKIVIQVLASGAAGLMLGYFLVSDLSVGGNGFETMLMFMGSAFLGSLLAFLIVTLIYNKGTKRFVKSIPTFIGSFVAIAIFYLAISSGLVGVSSVPKVEKIKSVAVFNEPDYNYNLDENPVIVSKGNGFEKANFYIEDKEVIKNTVALHQAIVDGLHDEAGAFFGFSDNFYLSSHINKSYEPYSIRIDYVLDNGKKISKSYIHSHFNYDNIKDELNAVVSSDVYKQQYFKLANCASADEANVSLMNIYPSKRYTNQDPSSSQSVDAYYGNNVGVIAGSEEWVKKDVTDSEMVNEIFSSLQEEFLADSNYAETLKANSCEYVEQTRDNFEIYDEIVYNIDISYSTQLSYEAAEKIIEKLDGVVSGVHLDDPEENIVITKDSYPRTWELLDNYFESEGADQVYLYRNNQAIIEQY